MEKSLKEDEQTMGCILGVPQMYFPPEYRLADQQIRQLKNSIPEQWWAFHYQTDFRKGEFEERQ